MFEALFFVENWPLGIVDPLESTSECIPKVNSLFRLMCEGTLPFFSFEKELLFMIFILAA